MEKQTTVVLEIVYWPGTDKDLIDSIDEALASEGIKAHVIELREITKP